MNRFILTLICSLSFIWSQAAVLTVDNSPTGGAQFADLQAAIDAATAGDTLHVIGSGLSYGAVILRKQLFLFGTGYNPAFPLTQKTLIANITINQISPVFSPAGSVISGFEISGIGVNASTDATGITISRCNIANLFLGNICPNWVIEHNIINNMGLFNNANVVVRNNIIQNQITSSNQPTVLITNNIFTNTTASGNAFGSMNLATITNNIFYLGRSPQGATNCIFSNNISFGTPDDALLYGSNTGTNNQVTVDPMFLSAATGGYTPEKDWRLAAASPGINAGTDGTDIGLYGGIRPFPVGGAAPFYTSAPPAIPQIEQFTLFNPNVAQGDSLQVEIRARKQD